MKHGQICKSVPIAPSQPELVSSSNNAKMWPSSSSGGRRHKTTTVLPVTNEKKSRKETAEKIQKNNGDKKSKHRNTKIMEIAADKVEQLTVAPSTAAPPSDRRRPTTSGKTERRVKGSRSRVTPKDYR